MGILSFFSRYCPFGCFCCYVPTSKRARVPVVKDLEQNIEDDDTYVLCSKRESRIGKKVRVICISDTHGKHSDLKIPNGDILIHAGDFSTCYKLSTKESAKEFDEWLGNLPHKHKIVVCGNHDGWFENNVPLKSLSNAYLLRGECIELEGLRLFGAPWRPKRGCCYRADAFGYPANKLQQLWDNVSESIDVLVTHGPPFSIRDKERAGNIGDPLLLDLIERCKPVAHIFGHVHENHGVSVWNGEYSARESSHKKTLHGNPKCNPSDNSENAEVLFVNASILRRGNSLNQPIVFDVLI